MDKFKSHPSIVKIKADNKSFVGLFKFRKVTMKEMENLVQNLDCTINREGKFQPKLSNCYLKWFALLSKIVNHSIWSGKFPNRLKLIEITPIPKKGDNQCVGDYRPISILPTVSKLFEKAMANQLSVFFLTKFSSLLCGFRKGHSTQHSLAKLLKSWQKNWMKEKLSAQSLWTYQKLTIASSLVIFWLQSSPFMGLITVALLCYTIICQIDFTESLALVAMIGWN